MLVQYEAKSIHVLACQLQGIEILQDQFGKAAVEAILVDCAAVLNEEVSTLLAGHRRAKLPVLARPGRWCWGLVLIEADDALADADEQAESLAAAALGRTQRILASMFGGRSGQLTLTFTVLVAPAVFPEDFDAWLDSGLAAASHHVLQSTPGERESLQALIAHNGLRTLFQPVVELRSRKTIGYEALSRGPEAGPFESAGELFTAAERLDLTVPLEIACARQAMELSATLPPEAWLAVNLGLDAFATPGVIESLARPGVVFEITEHLPLDGLGDHSLLMAESRARGARIALDDVGCGFAGIAVVRAVRPDIVKLCMTVVRGANISSDHLADIARSIAEFRSLGAAVLAEGVETEEQADCLLAAGATLAQGWLFGRPAAVDVA